MDIFRQNSSARENLGLLAVMDALADRENQKKITQRELARETGLNLKKVNYCLHKLLEKGYVKFQRVKKNPDKRAYLYILTPAGLTAKSQLTYRFLKFSLEFYTKMEDKLERCLCDMASEGIEQVVLYGVSDVARILMSIADYDHLSILGIIDGDFDAQEFNGIPVIHPRKLNELQFDGVLITSLDGFEEAEYHLQNLSVAKEKIWKLT